VLAAWRRNGDNLLIILSKNTQYSEQINASLLGRFGKGEEPFTAVLVLLAPGGDLGGKTARAVVHKSVEGVENGRDALFDRL